MPCALHFVLGLVRAVEEGLSTEYSETDEIMKAKRLPR